MTIRDVLSKDYNQLTALFKEFFVFHNRFSQSDKEVMIYLKEQSNINKLIIHESDGKIDGAMFIVKTGENDSKTHMKWKFRHFAYKNNSVARTLLDYSEKFVKDQSKTSKIELTIAETEEDIKFLKSNGYIEEGALKHHYRWNETCFILSKWFEK